MLVLALLLLSVTAFDKKYAPLSANKISITPNVTNQYGRVCHKNMDYHMKCHLFGTSHPNFQCRLPYKAQRQGILHSRMDKNCRPVLNESFVNNRQHCIQ